MPTWGGILAELNEFKQKNPKRSAGQILDEVRRKYIKALNARTGRNVILYSSSWTVPRSLEPGLISLTPEDVQGFMEVTHGLKGDAVDLILHSPGGSAEATESIVTYLRTKFSDVRVFVPHAAMSAATMLACSANRLVMGNHSFLGPIDPQFIVQTDLGRMSVPAYSILQQFEKAKAECKNPALLASWLPILKQYGPALLVQCEVAQDLSQSLVAKWLETYMFKGEKDRKQKSGHVAKELANHSNFKSHGRFIGRAQAKALGLAIDALEADQGLQDDVLSIFHTTNHTFNASSVVKIIENHLEKAWCKVHKQIAIPQQVVVPMPAPVPPSNPQPAPLPPPPAALGEGIIREDA